MGHAIATESQTQRAIELLVEGLSTRQVEKMIGLSRQWVSRIARKHGITLKRPRRFNDEKRAELIEHVARGESVKTIARRVGVSTSTASRYTRAKLDETGLMSFQRTRSARRCPTHGAVNVWPCVACSAMAEKG